MAAAAFAALISLQNNLNLINNHPTHSFSFEVKQVQSLWKSVALIDFMESYGTCHGSRKDAAEALERRIARAAQAAEDVVESHVVDQIRCGRTMRASSPRFLLDLQKVTEDMDYMRRKAMDVKARTGTEAELEQQPPPHSSPSLTADAATATKMVGSDDSLVQLLDLLVGVPSNRHVVPIVGMGGIGKTTLATEAFRHPLTMQHFDVCLWATISQHSRVGKILNELLSHLRKSVSVNVDESMCSGTVDELGLELHKSLYGRRYLIVLDDMWSLQAWEEMNFFFPDTDNGSRIVVTTRHLDVANCLDISSLEMSFLDEGSSWDLFCHKAFAAGQACPSELVEIGTKIVGKCKGLPLTIVVVGGQLRKSPMTLEYWENVAQHMDSILNSTEQCMNVLHLSYSYLPAHLKPCFLLMGAFAEDERIYAGDVFDLWTAEGFIEPTGLEVVAECYLWDLFERNLILVNQVSCSGGILYLKLHDLVRELCRKIAKKEEFLCVTDTPQAIHTECRVIINGKVGEANHQMETSDARIRSLMYQGCLPSRDLKLLRTLNKVVTASISESIFQLVNLRFLRVELDYKAFRALYYLPASISLLWNLQILRISVPLQSKVIAPYEIWEMLQLRHLEVIPICLLDPLPVERSDDRASDGLVLRNLQTLSMVENLRLSEEVCKRIPNIRELQVSYCDAMSDYCPHNLGCFRELEFLVCKFDLNLKWREFALSLNFPSSLTDLHLSGCGVDWEEITMMVGSLPHLLSLRLYQHSVIGPVWSPVEGKFLCLRNLDICNCDELVYLNADSSHFPALESLHLRRLSKMDEFPSGIGEIPTLQAIELEYCSISSTVSAMRTLVEQEKELVNEGLRVYVSFQGDEETLESFNQMVREEDLNSNNIILFLKREY